MSPASGQISSCFRKPMRRINRPRSLSNRPRAAISDISAIAGRVTDYYCMIDSFPEYQLCLVDTETDYPVAVANSVPLSCSGPHELPAEGWDWVVETAVRTKTRPNMLGGLAVSVPAIHRSKGYARVIIRSLIDLAKSEGTEWCRGARAANCKSPTSLGPDCGLHVVDRRDRTTLRSLAPQPCLGWWQTA